MQRLVVLLFVFLIAQTVFGETFYQVLGVSESASIEEIKKAYRRLAMKHHPDRHTTEEDKKTNEIIFKKIKDAYDTLSDENKRKNYDRGTQRNHSQDSRTQDNRYQPESDSTRSGSRATSPYDISKEFMSILEDNRHRGVDEMVRVGLDYLERNIIFTDAKTELQLNTRIHVLSDVFTRLGAMAEFPVMEAAYKAAFAHLRKVAKVSPDKYEYNFNINYEYLLGIYNFANRRATNENLRYRQHMYNALNFAEKTKVQPYEYAGNGQHGGPTCSRIFGKVTINGKTYDVPIEISIKVGR